MEFVQAEGRLLLPATPVDELCKLGIALSLPMSEFSK